MQSLSAVKFRFVYYPELPWSIWAATEIYPSLILGWEDLLEEGMATTPVFLPRKFLGQRSLAGYSPGVIRSQTQLSMQR